MDRREREEVDRVGEMTVIENDVFSYINCIVIK